MIAVRVCHWPFGPLCLGDPVTPCHSLRQIDAWTTVHMQQGRGGMPSLVAWNPQDLEEPHSGHSL